MKPDKDVFIENLLKLDSIQEIKALCLNEINALKSIYQLSTVRNYITSYRKEIKNHPELLAALTFMKLSFKDNLAVERNQMERLKPKLK